jgi:hypothetical protein
MENSPRVETLTDASGAVRAARKGRIVVVVDVIDMSTTLEGALDAGAVAVFGASPDTTRAPVMVDPFHVGVVSARAAREHQTGIIIVSEPRVGDEQIRLDRCRRLQAGVRENGGEIVAIIPNMGAETARIFEMSGLVVAAATDTGGVAYDAALQAGGIVTTGTVARTLRKKGLEPALAAAKRAITLYEEHGASGIAVIAASGNSWEDVLAARFIARQIRSIYREQRA